MIDPWHITNEKNSQGIMIYYVSPPGYNWGFMATTGEQYAKDWKRQHYRDEMKRNLTIRSDLYGFRNAAIERPSLIVAVK